MIGSECDLLDVPSRIEGTRTPTTSKKPRVCPRGAATQPHSPYSCRRVSSGLPRLTHSGPGHITRLTRSSEFTVRIDAFPWSQRLKTTRNHRELERHRCAHSNTSRSKPRSLGSVSLKPLDHCPSAALINFQFWSGIVFGAAPPVDNALMHREKRYWAIHSATTLVPEAPDRASIMRSKPLATSRLMLGNDTNSSSRPAKTAPYRRCGTNSTG